MNRSLLHHAGDQKETLSGSSRKTALTLGTWEVLSSPNSPSCRPVRGNEREEGKVWLTKVKSALKSGGFASKPKSVGVIGG